MKEVPRPREVETPRDPETPEPQDYRKARGDKCSVLDFTEDFVKAVEGEALTKGSAITSIAERFKKGELRLYVHVDPALKTFGHAVLKASNGNELVITEDFKDWSYDKLTVELQLLGIPFEEALHAAAPFKRIVQQVLAIGYWERFLEDLRRSMADLSVEDRLDYLAYLFNKEGPEGERLKGYFRDLVASIYAKRRNKDPEAVRETLEEKGKDILEAAHVSEIAEAIAIMLMDIIDLKPILYSGGKLDLYINDRGLLREGGFVTRNAQRIFGIKKRSLAQELENALMAEGKHYDREMLSEVLNPPGKLLLKNRVLNLDTLELEELNDKELFTFRLDWALDPARLKKIPEMSYEDFKERAPKFFALYEQVFDNEESRNQAMEMLGATLITSPVRKLFLLIGPRGTGKTTFLTVLNRVFKPAFANVEFSKITNPEWRWNYSLMTALINTSAERSEVIARSPDRIKQLVGEYYLEYEAKHRNPIRARNITTHIFALNQPPIFPHYGDFIESLYIIFTTEKAVENPREMRLVVEEILAEKDAIAEFIVWCYYQLTKEGYVNFKHDMSEEEKRDYLIREGNPVGLFLREECILGADYREKGLNLYERFEEFCKERGYKPPSLVKFYSILRSMGFEDVLDRDTHTKYFKGIALKETAEDEGKQRRLGDYEEPFPY